MHVLKKALPPVLLGTFTLLAPSISTAQACELAKDEYDKMDRRHERETVAILVHEYENYGGTAGDFISGGVFKGIAGILDRPEVKFYVAVGDRSGAKGSEHYLKFETRHKNIKEWSIKGLRFLLANDSVFSLEGDFTSSTPRDGWHFHWTYFKVPPEVWDMLAASPLHTIRVYHDHNRSSDMEILPERSRAIMEGVQCIREKLGQARPQEAVASPTIDTVRLKPLPPLEPPPKPTTEPKAAPRDEGQGQLKANDPDPVLRNPPPASSKVADIPNGPPVQQTTEPEPRSEQANVQVEPKEVLPQEWTSDGSVRTTVLTQPVQSVGVANSDGQLGGAEVKSEFGSLRKDTIPNTKVGEGEVQADVIAISDSQSSSAGGLDSGTGASHIVVAKEMKPTAVAPEGTRPSTHTRLHVGIEGGKGGGRNFVNHSMVLGAALCLEQPLTSVSSLLFDASYIWGEGSTGAEWDSAHAGNRGRFPDRHWTTGQIGVRLHHHRVQQGFHWDFMAGYSGVVDELYVPNRVNKGYRYSGGAVASLGLGVTIGNRCDVSLRYQLPLFVEAYDILGLKSNKDEIGPNEFSSGFVLGRLSFIIGRAPEKQARGPIGTRPPKYVSERDGRRYGSEPTAGSKAELQARVRDLSTTNEEQEAQINQLVEETRDLTDVINRHGALISALRDSLTMSSARTEHVSAQPSGSPLDRFVGLRESPTRFGPNVTAVYTVLHAFSDPATLDTFRVMTIQLPSGGTKNQLEIVASTGRLLRKEEILSEPDPPSKNPEVLAARIERDLLRAQSLLGPWSFRTPPVTTNLLLQFERREQKGYLFDVGEPTWNAILGDQTAVGFVYREADGSERVLVYSKAERRTVDIAPITQ